MDTQLPSNKSSSSGIGQAVLGIVLGLLLILVILLTLNYFKIISLNKFIGQNSQNVTASMPKILPETLELPVDINKLFVKSATLHYVFEAEVRGVKVSNTSTNSAEIITSIQSQNNVPSFVTSESTEIYLFSNGKEIKATLKDLKPDQTINVIMIYNLKSKKWSVARIRIMSETKTTTKPAIPTMSPKK